MQTVQEIQQNAYCFVQFFDTHPHDGVWEHEFDHNHLREKRWIYQHEVALYYSPSLYLVPHGNLFLCLIYSWKTGLNPYEGLPDCHLITKLVEKERHCGANTRILIRALHLLWSEHCIYFWFQHFQLFLKKKK